MPMMPRKGIKTVCRSLGIDIFDPWSRMKNNRPAVWRGQTTSLLISSAKDSFGSFGREDAPSDQPTVFVENDFEAVYNIGGFKWDFSIPINGLTICAEI